MQTLFRKLPVQAVPPAPGEVQVVLDPRFEPQRAQGVATLVLQHFKTATEKTLTTYEHADGVMLVASWFRRKPRERDKTMTPKAALDKCIPHAPA